VALVLSYGIRRILGPRLSHLASAEHRALSAELQSSGLRSHTPDSRVGRLTNTMLSNKYFYSMAFRHLPIDELAASVWRSAAPLKSKFFCWLGK
jgi:hypothetical protein